MKAIPGNMQQAANEACSPKTKTRSLALAAVAAALLFGASLHAADAIAAANGPMVKLLEFHEVKLLDALNMLSEQTGINMVASPDAAKAQITLTLRNIPAKVAVETLCKSNNLSFKDDNGILRVMTTQEFQRDLTTFREEKTEVFTLLYPNAVSAAVAIRDLYGDRVQLSLNSEESTDQTNEINERFDRFDAVDQRGTSTGIFDGGGTTGFSGGGGSRGVAIGGSSFTQRSNVTRDNTIRRRDEQNSTRNRQDLRDLTVDDLAALKQAQQNGNAELIDKLMKQYRQHDADIYLSLSRRNNLVLVRTSDERALQDIGKLIRRIDVPTSVVLLEVKVMSIELGKDQNSAFDFQFTNGMGVAGAFSTGNIQPPLADLLPSAARPAVPIPLGGTGLRSDNLAFQYVDKNFRARLQALESKNKVTTLATPMLMTANNEVSRLFVGDERPIVRGINSTTLLNQNATTSTGNTTVEFRNVGTTLLITPNINADRSVTLRIVQENSAIKRNDANIPVVTSDGGVTQQPVDVVATRSVSGTLIAADAMTLAIGGLIEENIGDMRAQIPLIGNLPGVGILFRRQSKTKTRSELVILIRPRILTTPCEGEAASKDLLDKLSIHPKARNPEGTLNLYGPDDPLPKEKDQAPLHKREHD